MKSNKRNIIIVTAIAAVSLVLAFFLSSLQSGATGTIVLESAPSTLTLTLDGKEIANSGNHRIATGDHTLQASQEGFESKIVEFTLEEDEQEQIIIYILPDSDTGREFLKNNPEEEYRIEGAVGSEIDAQSQLATAENPIIADLPVVDRTFRIDYGASVEDPEEPGGVAIYIRAIDQQGRDDALNWMRTFGYDPNDYEIIYINPLEEN